MKFFQSPIFTLLILGVIIALGASSVRLWPRRVTVNNEISNLENRITEAENSRNQLAKLIDYFHSDAFLEQEARLRLNYKKPGEKVAFVYRDDEVEPRSSVIEDTRNLPNLEQWWRWLWQ